VGGAVVDGALTWVLPAGRPTGAAGDAYAIHNPGSREARVDLEIHLDLAEGVTAPEPVTVTVGPGRTEVVTVAASALAWAGSGVTDVSGRVADGPAGPLTWWVGVRVLNEVPVVVERVGGAAAEGGAVSWAAGHAAGATSWVVGGGGGPTLAIVNPGEAIAVVSLSQGGEPLTQVEVAPLSRALVDLTVLGSTATEGPLSLTSDEPVVVDRTDPTGAATRPGVPVAGTESPLRLPFPT
jgi:hypothetical protein